MNKLGLTIISISFIIINFSKVSADCERSRYILGAEDICWTNKVEVVERIQHAQKKIVNFAKKTLGMEAEKNDEPQKCDYYYCIFKQMNLINPDYDVPCITRTTNWVKKNVLYNEAVPLLERIQACSGELGKSFELKQKFLAANVGVSDRKVDDSNQTRCEVAAEYMKCLAEIAKDSECPVFQYP